MITVENPDGKDIHAIQSVSWRVIGGAPELVNSQTISTDPQTGSTTFRDTPVNQLQGVGPTWHWGPTPGTKTFEVTVVYADNTTGKNTISIDVKTPHVATVLYGAIVDPNYDQNNPDWSNPAPPNPDASGGILSLTSPPDPTIGWVCLVTDDNYPGLVGVNQIVTSGRTSAQTQGRRGVINWTTLSRPQKQPDGSIQLTAAKFNLLDGGPFYTATKSARGVVASQDSPDIPEQSIDMKNPISLSFQAAFKDTVMVTSVTDPNSPEWVPVQSWTWSINIAASQNAQKVLVATNVTNPTCSAPQQEKSYPQWIDKASDFRTWWRV